jgi:agmatinase
MLPPILANGAERAMAEYLDPATILRRLPYQGPLTFWRAPNVQDLTGVDVAVYGVPFDAGTSNRPGARFGPRSIREQSCYVGLYDQCWPNDYAFKDRFRLIDYGDVASFPGRSEDMIAAVEETVSKMVDGNVATLGLGGDHLTSYPALKAHAQKNGPLSLIHFDAHPDLVEAPHLFHGSVFGAAVQEGLIDPQRSIQIGIRTPSPPSPKLHVLTADRCLRMNGETIAARIKEVVGTAKCYITLDVDAMDPAYTGGTGTPAPGGLTSALQREILWHLKGVDAVGGDVVEVSPPYDAAAQTAIVGAIVAMDILHILGEARSAGLGR